MSDPIFARNVPGLTESLAEKTVGVAGCGGLGSNAAMLLVRAGVRRLLLADFDRVEVSNLNRQFYFREDIGHPKTEALAERLRSIRPDLELQLLTRRLTAESLVEDFQAADLLLECFDAAEAKKWLIETWARCHPDRPLVCASGVSGLGASGALKWQRAGKVYFCGDFTSQMSEGLCSARVMQVAAMQAHLAIELLVRGGVS